MGLLGLPIAELLPRLLALAIAMVLALSLHEAAHAWMAFRLGDDTAKRAGRLTLNPLVHLDPLGSILILILGIGWARPTPVNPWRLRYGPRVGGALVALAGPVSNALLALVATILWRFMFNHIPPSGPSALEWVLSNILGTLVVLNLVLCLFNLIPLAPLDGNSVLNGLVSARTARALAPLQKYGPQILLAILLLGMVTNFNVLGDTLFAAVHGLTRLLAGNSLALLYFGY